MKRGEAFLGGRVWEAKHRVKTGGEKTKLHFSPAYAIFQIYNLIINR
jgi:hypothetical protein